VFVRTRMPIRLANYSLSKRIHRAYGTARYEVLNANGLSTKADSAIAGRLRRFVIFTATFSTSGNWERVGESELESA
jgi:hypothetical protein